MSERKWAQEAIEDLKRQFEEIAGTAYQDSAFQSPDTTQVAVRKIVAAIKVLEAESRKTEIKMEVERLPKAGDPHIPPKDKEHLPEEYAKSAAITDLWANFR